MKTLGATLARLLAPLEFAFVAARGRLFGISSVVRYLRNPNPRLSVRLLRKFGATVGRHTRIKRGLIIDNASEDAHSTGDFRHLVIGENCYLGDEVYLDLAEQIVVGDHAVIAARVSIVTHADCNRSAYLAALFPRICRPVRVESGAWLGLGASLLPGVTVARECVIGAGAVVTADTLPRTLHAGVPAKKIKDLS